MARVDHPHSVSPWKNYEHFASRQTRVPAQILHNPNRERAISLAIDSCLELVVEGFFDQAASILRALWKADCTATISKHQVRMGLEFIWSATSFRFPGIGWLPSSPLMLSTLEIGHRQRLFPVTSSETISHCRSQFRTHPGSVSRWNLVRALVGVRYLNPNTTRTQMPPPKDEAEALHLLHEYLSAPPSQASIDGPDHADCLALAVDLSLKYGQEDKARLYLDYAAARMADGVMDEAASISKAVHAGPLLKEGLVARRTGLTSDVASSFANSITSALTARLTQGETRPYEHMSWTSLLQSLQKKERETQLNAEATPILPFFRPPAKEEDIREAETRLGIVLPEDLKEFLRVTNGLGSHDPFLGYSAIASIDKIQWDTITCTSSRLRYRPLTPTEALSKDLLLPLLSRVLVISPPSPATSASTNPLLPESPSQQLWLVEPQILAQAKLALGDEPVLDEWLFLRKGEFFSVEEEGFDENMGSFRQVMERRLSELVDRGY